MASEDAAIREDRHAPTHEFVVYILCSWSTLYDISMNLTGMTPEQMEAVNATSAPYQRDSIFLSLEDKNEKDSFEVLDFSHFNPFDMLIRPFEAVLNSLDETANFSEVRLIPWATMGSFLRIF